MESSRGRTELTQLLRGSFLNLAGGVLTAASGFVSVYLLTRLLTDLSEFGAFLTAVAVINLGGRLSQLGTGTGLIRFISRARAHDRPGDVPAIVFVGVVPALGLAVLLGVLIVVGADVIAPRIAAADSERVAHHLRMAGWFLPSVTMVATLTAATRGWGTMLPATMIANLLRPGLQLVGLGLLVALAIRSPDTTALVYWSPMAVAAVAAAVVLSAMVRRTAPHPTTSPRVAGPYWRFTGPRSVASGFASGIEWSDALFVAAIAGPRAAGIYTASTRLLTIGRTVQFAATQALLPQVSRLLAVDDTVAAQRVFRTAATWSITLTWPWFVLVLLYAEPLLAIFGPEFASGAPAVRILALAWMVGTALGPVEAVLLMAGRSVLNVMDLGAALTVNVVLNLLLIPRLGLTGAALAWLGSILVNNLAPLVQVRAATGMTPLDTAAGRIALAALASFGGSGALGRALVGPTLFGLVIAGVSGAVAYLLLLWRIDPQGRLRQAVLALLYRRRNVIGTSDPVDEPAREARLSR